MAAADPTAALAQEEDSEEEDLAGELGEPGKLNAKTAKVLLKRLKRALAKPDIQKSIKAASASVLQKGEMQRRNALGLIWAVATRGVGAVFGFPDGREGSDPMFQQFLENSQDPVVYKLLGDVEELLDVPPGTWWGFTHVPDQTPTLTLAQAKDAAGSVVFALKSRHVKEALRKMPSNEAILIELGYYVRPIKLAFGFGYEHTSVQEFFDAIRAHADNPDVLFLWKDIEKLLNYAPGALLAASSMEENPEEPLEIPEKPLVGKIVEISTGGLEVRTVATKQKGRLVDVDGQRGKVISWDEAEESYVVQTFEGVTVFIKDENNLEVCKLPKAVEGGSHLIYSAGGSPDTFGRAIADWLDHKGFCMIQMSENKEMRKRAAQTITDVGADMQDAFRQEHESAYLGTNNNTEVKALPADAMDGTGSPLQVLCTQVLSTVNALTPYTKDYFDYDCWATTSIWARTSEASNDVDDSPTLNEKDTQGSHVQAYERFLLGRKICVLYMVDNTGGEVHLSPRNGSVLAAAGFGALTIPISGNKMLIFRHDQMRYSYQPKGPSLALQSWMLTDIPLAQNNLKVAPLNGVKGPPPGANAQVMNVDTRMGGDANGAEKVWAMWASGSDTVKFWPESRWSAEPYYTDQDDFRQVGKSYNCHGSFMCDQDAFQFDNEFFKIGDKEATVMCPGQRAMLELGYSCMQKSGLTRETLQGENVGVFLGDVGMDWFAPVPLWLLGENFEKTSKTECLAGVHVGITAVRLSYTFDLKGPLQTTDTACSASLVALQCAHKALMHCNTDATSSGSLSAPHSVLTGGCNSIMGPESYIGQCMAGMLSHIGRCFTFDRTADGFQRGEGHGTMFVKWSGDVLDIEERMACLVGSVSNQDGRSASLTAPNGPAQQDAIRRSMIMADVDPSLISVCECHGTGTALGDPIEVGSLQGVMRGKRSFPLLNTSAKTNVCHLEACAGACGIIKCVLMVNYSCGPPNCHLRGLNPNLIVEGYPVYFQQELCDTTFTTSFLGVSSFGFGGTNSRADVYGRCTHGPISTGNLWSAERVEQRALAYANGKRMGSRRGQDKLDASVMPKVPISIIGSRDNFKEATEMTQVEPGCWTHRVALGDTRQASFRLCVGGDRTQALYPAVDNAAPTAVICGGPGSFFEAKDHRWLIDGRCDAGYEGTTYIITFKWQGEKCVSWEPESVAIARGVAIKDSTSDDYHISGTWGSNVMSCVSQKERLYEGELVINTEGVARFQFRRGNDVSQTIYPNDAGAASGPDMYDKGNQFVVRGSPSEKMKVQLRFQDRGMYVSVFSDEGMSFKWQGQTSDDGDMLVSSNTKAPKHEYHVCGSWYRWQPEKLTCISEKDGVYAGKLTINFDGVAKFQFSRNKDAMQMIYPNHSGSVCGPDKDGRNRNFEIHGAPGQKMEVRLSVKNARMSVSVFSENTIEQSWVSENIITYYVSGSFNGWRHTRLYEDRAIKGLYRYHTVVVDDEPVEYKILFHTDGSRILQGLSTVVPEADRRVLDAVRDFKGKVGSTWEILLDLNQDDPNRMVYHRPATYSEDAMILM